MDFFANAFSGAQQWLFESLIQPAMFALGLGNLLADGYDATGWLLVGLIQLAVLVAVIGPLQRWRPVEPVTDRAAVRVDILYTVIHRLGLFRLVECPGSHETWFSNPTRLAQALLEAGRD